MIIFNIPQHYSAVSGGQSCRICQGFAVPAYRSRPPPSPRVRITLAPSSHSRLRSTIKFISAFVVGCSTCPSTRPRLLGWGLTFSISGHYLLPSRQATRRLSPIPTPAPLPRRTLQSRYCIQVSHVAPLLAASLLVNLLFDCLKSHPNPKLQDLLLAPACTRQVT